MREESGRQAEAPSVMGEGSCSGPRIHQPTACQSAELPSPNYEQGQDPESLLSSSITPEVPLPDQPPLLPILDV